MNRNLFFSTCLTLLLAPTLLAQTSGNGPVAVPQRPLQTHPPVVVPTNTPANRPFGNPPTGPGRRPTPPMRNPFNPAANAPAPAPAIPNFPGRPAAPEAPLQNNPDIADISYNFPAIPLDQLLDIYADLVGRTMLRATTSADAVQGTTTITLKTETKLTRSEAITALETILGMNGITIIPIGDKFAKVVSEANAGKAGGTFSTSTNIPIAGKFVTQIVQIKYVDIKDLTEVLKAFNKAPESIIAIPSTETLILRDYAENVNRMMDIIRQIDVLTPNSIKPEIIPIKYALASDIASALGELGASGGGSVGKQTSGANFRQGTGTSTAGGSVGNFGGTSTGGVGGGYPGQPATTTTSGLASSATSGRSTFQQNLQHIVASAAGGAGQFQLFGQTKIIADERTNSLLVFANDEDMKMIKLIISKLDVVLPQVLIDAIIMEINLTYTRNTGVSYGTQNGGSQEFSGIGGLNNLSSAASGFLTGSTTTNTANAISGGSTLANLPGGFSYFGKYGNDLNVVLEAVAGDSRINVLSRPRIQTSHAVEADLFIGNTVPYVTGTYSYYGGGPSATYQQLEVGIHLQVLPLINNDGLVVMDIQADVEQLGTPVEIQGVGEVPTTTKRQAGAKVAVRDGETIILGGFISDSRSKALSGIPGLMNIPVLGNLFRSTAIQNLRTELIMLMRPTVLPNPEVAAVVATEERNKLAGVKAAEWEIREDEAKVNMKLEQQMVQQAAKDAAEAKKAAEKAAKRQKGGEIDTSTNIIPFNTVPGVEDQ